MANTWNRVGSIYEQILDATVQSLTEQIKVLELYISAELIVNLADRVGANSSCTGQFCLADAIFTQNSG